MSDPFARPGPRIERVSHEGRDVWVKRAETLQGLHRVLKGDPRSGFEREKAALQSMQGRGLPVPDLVASGDGYFATEAVGENLLALMRREGQSSPAFHRALGAGAAALARLHGAGVSHGRPNLKDICWKNGDVRFIDFERASPSRNTAKGHATDLLLFVYNTMAETGGNSSEAEIAITAYRENDTAGIWPLAVARAKRMQALRYLVLLLPRRIRSKKDYATVWPFFEKFSKS